MSAARRADVEEEARKARSPQGRRRLHPAKRVLLGLAGGTLLLVGLALLVLPGPGLLLVLAGLILLGRALPSVGRFEEPVRTRAMQAVDASVASRWRIAGSVLTGLALITAGVVWGARLVPRLPFGGWSTGSSLILSGLIVLGLLLWSYRRVRRPSDCGE